MILICLDEMSIDVHRCPSWLGNLTNLMQSALKQSEDLEVNVAHQDANQAWPALVAKAFGADFHNIAWSGAGVVWNAGAGCSADVPFHDLYSRMLGSSPTLDEIDEIQHQIRIIRNQYIII